MGGELDDDLLPDQRRPPLCLALNCSILDAQSPHHGLLVARIALAPGVPNTVPHHFPDIRLYDTVVK